MIHALYRPALKTAIRTAVPCADCGTEEGHLNTGNVRPGRYSAVAFGFAPGEVICKSCHTKHWNNRAYHRKKRARKATP